MSLNYGRDPRTPAPQAHVGCSREVSHHPAFRRLENVLPGYNLRLATDCVLVMEFLVDVRDLEAQMSSLSGGILSHSSQPAASRPRRFCATTLCLEIKYPILRIRKCSLSLHNGTLSHLSIDIGVLRGGRWRQFV